MSNFFKIICSNCMNRWPFNYSQTPDISNNEESPINNEKPPSYDSILNNIVTKSLWEYFRFSECRLFRTKNLPPSYVDSVTGTQYQYNVEPPFLPSFGDSQGKYQGKEWWVNFFCRERFDQRILTPTQLANLPFHLRHENKLLCLTFIFSFITIIVSTSLIANENISGGFVLITLMALFVCSMIIVLKVRQSFDSDEDSHYNKIKEANIIPPDYNCPDYKTFKPKKTSNNIVNINNNITQIQPVIPQYQPFSADVVLESNRLSNTAPNLSKQESLSRDALIMMSL